MTAKHPEFARVVRGHSETHNHEGRRPCAWGQTAAGDWYRQGCTGRWTKLAPGRYTPPAVRAAIARATGGVLVMRCPLLAQRCQRDHDAGRSWIRRDPLPGMGGLYAEESACRHYATRRDALAGA